MFKIIYAKEMILCKIVRNVVKVVLITLLIPKGSFTQWKTSCQNFLTGCIALEECTELHQQLQKRDTPNKELDKLLQALHCGFQNGRRMVHFSSVCCEDKSLLADQATCGIQYRDRVLGGERAEVDEHPWVVMVRIKIVGNDFKMAECGGSLISSRYILTAAHCIKYNVSVEIVVRLGEWDTTTNIDCYRNKCNEEAIDLPIEKVIPHEDFVFDDGDNDIALLRLARTVEFTDFIKPICLPLSDDLRNESFYGYYAELAGWGVTDNYNANGSTVKLKVQLPIVYHGVCQRIAARKYGANVTDNQICAGRELGQSSCRGDSGSPLMVRSPHSDQWMAIGIASYGGVKCGEPFVPRIYTRVGAYIKWILSKLEP